MKLDWESHGTDGLDAAVNYLMSPRAMAAPVQRAELSLAHVDRAGRMQAWHDVVARAIWAGACQVDDSTALELRIQHCRVEGVIVNAIQASAQRVYYGAADVARIPLEAHCVLVQKQGSCTVGRGAHAVALRPGDAVVYSSMAATEFRVHDRNDQLLMFVPSDAFRAVVKEHAPQPNRLVKINAAQAGVDLLTRSLTWISGQSSERAPHDTLKHLRDIALHSMAAALCAQAGEDLAAPGAEPSRLTAYHRARVNDYIEQHLGNPDLRPSQIAQGVGISISQLHRLYRDEGDSVMARIWARRLQASEALLKSPRHARMTVAEIAFRYGFKDAAHFSRVFKARLGQSPREWRARQMAHHDAGELVRA